MDDKKEIKQKALDYIEELEVYYLPIEEQFEELKTLLSNLEDSIVILPVLGITETFESVMRDKMVMYEAQISAFRALYAYLQEHIIGPNKRELITRRGPLPKLEEAGENEEE